MEHDFEALVARIVADYAAEHDPAREAAWTPSCGRRSAAVLRRRPSDRRAAQPRILLVNQDGRGHGPAAASSTRCRSSRAARATSACGCGPSSPRGGQADLPRPRVHAHRRRAAPLLRRRPGRAGLRARARRRAPRADTRSAGAGGDASTIARSPRESRTAVPISSLRSRGRGSPRRECFTRPAALSWAAGGSPATSAPTRRRRPAPRARASCPPPGTWTRNRHCALQHVERRAGPAIKRAEPFFARLPSAPQRRGVGRRDRGRAGALRAAVHRRRQSGAGGGRLLAGGRAVDADRKEDLVLDGVANAVT